MSFREALRWLLEGPPKRDRWVIRAWLREWDDYRGVPGEFETEGLALAHVREMLLSGPETWVTLSGNRIVRLADVESFEVFNSPVKA